MSVYQRFSTKTHLPAEAEMQDDESSVCNKGNQNKNLKAETVESGIILLGFVSVSDTFDITHCHLNHCKNRNID